MDTGAGRCRTWHGTGRFHDFPPGRKAIEFYKAGAVLRGPAPGRQKSASIRLPERGLSKANPQEELLLEIFAYNVFFESPAGGADPPRRACPCLHPKATRPPCAAGRMDHRLPQSCLYSSARAISTLGSP